MGDQRGQQALDQRRLRPAAGGSDRHAARSGPSRRPFAARRAGAGVSVWSVMSVLAGLAGIRLEQPVQMDDEIAHMGVVDGRLRLGLPGDLRRSCSRGRCRRCRARRGRGTRCPSASSARRRRPDAEAVSFRPSPAMSSRESFVWKRDGQLEQNRRQQNLFKLCRPSIDAIAVDHCLQAAARCRPRARRGADWPWHRPAACRDGSSNCPPASRRIRSAAARSQSCALGLMKVASSAPSATMAMR